MKFRAARVNLSSALATVSKASGDGRAQPISKCVRLVVDDSRLYLTATDFEEAIRTRLLVGYGTEGDGVVLPLDRLKPFIDGVDGDTVEFSDGSAGRVLVSCGRSRIQIAPQSLGDFPEPFPAALAATPDQPLIIPQADLKRTLTRCLPAVAGANEHRRVLSGVHVYASGDMAVFEATDSFRMAQQRLTLRGFHPDQSAVLAAATLEDVVPLLKDEGDAMLVLGQRAFIGVDEHEVMVPSLAGEYPPVSRFLREEHSTTARFSGVEMAVVVRMVMSLLRSTEFPRLSLTFSESGIALRYSDREVSDGEAEIPATVEGEQPLTIHFDPRLLRDMAETIPGEVLMAMREPHEPVQCYAVGDDGFVHLIVPKVVKEEA